MAAVMEDLGVQGDFLVSLEMRGSGGHEDVDTGFMLFSVCCFVLCRVLSEKEFTVFRGEVSQSLF